MDLDNNSSNILDHQPASQNGHKGQTATLFAPSERIASSTVFNLTDRLPIFSYLMTTNRVRWYRVIMRIFFQRHRELYRYQLTAQEIRDAVRDTFDPEYTLETMQQALHDSYPGFDTTPPDDAISRSVQQVCQDWLQL